MLYQNNNTKNLNAQPRAILAEDFFFDKFIYDSTTGIRCLFRPCLPYQVSQKHSTKKTPSKRTILCRAFALRLLLLNLFWWTSLANLNSNLKISWPLLLLIPAPILHRGLLVFPTLDTPTLWKQTNRQTKDISQWKEACDFSKFWKFPKVLTCATDTCIPNSNLEGRNVYNQPDILYQKLPFGAFPYGFFPLPLYLPLL